MSLFHNLTGDEIEVGVDSNVANTRGIVNFDEKIKGFKNKVLTDYERYNIDVNKSIAIIAKNNHLNNDQIQRIIEEVNTQIYLMEYNKSKNNTERNVEFEIANITKIKDLLDNNSIANQEVKDVPGDKGDAEMDKKASADSELSFLNYSPYKFSGMSVNSKYTESILEERKILNKLASAERESDRALEALVSSSETLSHSLIKYASMNRDCQSIFEDICHEAKMKKSTQLLIKEAMNKNIGFLKEARKLPNDFTVELKLVDFEDKNYNNFSLGEYSLNKKASEEIPTIEVNRQTVKGLKSLVELANKIVEKEEEYKNTSEKVANYNKMLQDIKK